ncbi:MAG TPA: peptidoglycan-binding protein [Candidatus Dormibacteraeota bacterium]|nr:peptidoglycan-binding protein [Candidatus Dormibacteraeota bacterium]
MPVILKLGSNCNDVKTLQNQLNTALTPSPRLVVDGSFGSNTRNAVLRFQQANWLVEDGEVGPCTWNVLLDTEDYDPILHSVPFIPQRTPTSCWAASTAMVTRTTIADVVHRTPDDLILEDGSLMNFSESNDPVTGSTRFAKANFMIVVPPTSWMPVALKSMLSKGPLVFDMLWNTTSYVQGHASPGHMIAVVGIRGDNDQSGKGTTLRIYDPWPPNKGDRYSVGYFKWIQEVPTRTYHIYHKV